MAAARRTRFRAAAALTGAGLVRGTAAGTRASRAASSADPLDRGGQGARPRRHEIGRDLRDDQRDDAVLAGIGDVEPTAPRRVGDARRRAEHFAAFVAEISDDPVRSDRTDVTAVIVGDENRDLAAGLRYDSHPGGTRERRL